MQSNETRNIAAQENTTPRTHRNSSLTGEGYVYWRWDENLKKSVPIRIAAGDQYTDDDGTVRTIDKDILIVLDEMDHREVLDEDAHERNRDWGFYSKLTAHESGTYSGKTPIDPWEEIAGGQGDPFEVLFPEEVPVDEKVEKVLEFLAGLTEAQRDLVYDHLGAWKYLEDIRREEEVRTGRPVTQQALSNRWNKIIARGCKHFGVDKPRKRRQ